VREALRAYPRRVLLGFFLVAAASLTFNAFFVLLPNHLVVELGVPISRGLAGGLLAWWSWRSAPLRWAVSRIGWGASRC
jgi:hypothetical protein